MTHQDLEFPYIAVIPYKVLSDKNLHPNAKLYYGCLSGLAKKEGYCWASDEQLAKLFEVKIRQVKRWNSDLEKQGYIYRETKNVPHKNEAGVFFWKKERKIFIDKGFSKNVSEGVLKDPIEGVLKDPSLEGVLKDPLIVEPLSVKKEIIKERPLKKKYGTYVEFTDQEYKTLEDNHGKELLELKISDMEAFLAEKGHGYKNYYTQMNAWCIRHKAQKAKNIPKQKEDLISKNYNYSKSFIKTNKDSLKLENIDISLHKQDLEIRFEKEGYVKNIDLMEFAFAEQLRNLLLKSGVKREFQF